MLELTLPRYRRAAGGALAAAATRGDTLGASAAGRSEEADMVPEINYWAVLHRDRVEHGRRLDLVHAEGVRHAVGEAREGRHGPPGRQRDVADHRHGARQLRHGVGARRGDGDRVALLRRRLPVDGDRARRSTLWAGFTAARFITHDAFEGRPTSLTVLNIAHELVTVLIMALIIGVWPPAGTV